MDANTRMEGIRFSGENVNVSVYSQLTSLDQQGELLSSRCAVYGREMSRATTMTLDQFLLGDEFDSDAVNSVRRHQFDIERDRKKSTTLKVACLQARIKTRDFCVEVEDQIAEYNSLVCMDFHDPTRLDWMKETLYPTLCLLRRSVFRKNGRFCHLSHCERRLARPPALFR